MQTERAMQSEPSWRALNEIPPSPYVIIRKKLSCEIEEFPHFSHCLPPSPHRFKISSNLFSASRVFYVLWLRRTEAAAAERTSRAKARKFMHETKIHAKSFRFLYANYSKALQAGTLKRGLGRRLGRGKSFGIYASRDSTNKEVGIKTLESQNAFKHSLLRSETGKIFRAKTCDKLVSKHQCRTVFLESHASSSSDCTSEKGTEEEKNKKSWKSIKRLIIYVNKTLIQKLTKCIRAGAKALFLIRLLCDAEDYWGNCGKIPNMQWKLNSTQHLLAERSLSGLKKEKRKKLESFLEVVRCRLFIKIKIIEIYSARQCGSKAKLFHGAIWHQWCWTVVDSWKVSLL